MHNDDSPLPNSGASDARSAVSTPATGSSRTPKPRPSPLIIPAGPPPSRQQYGTFIPPALAASSSGGGGGGDDDRAAKHAASMGLWGYMTSPKSPFVIQVKDHCRQQWIAVLLTICLVFGIVYVVVAVHAPPPAVDCASDFGWFLGENSGVAAYSNCRYSYAGEGLDHFASNGLRRISTGPKWQAIEYARRFWILTRLISFSELAEPALLMNTSYAVNVARNRQNYYVPLVHYSNPPGPRGTTATADNETAGHKDGIPKVGDLLVYAKEQRTLQNGHVAVVVGLRGPYSSLRNISADVAVVPPRRPLSPGTPRAVSSAAEEEADCLYYEVLIAEQNWGNAPWLEAEPPTSAQASQAPTATRRHYSRALLMRKYLPSNTFYIEDTHGQRIVGWVRPKESALQNK